MNPLTAVETRFLRSKQLPSLSRMNHMRAGKENEKQEMKRLEINPRRSEKNGIDSATVGRGKRRERSSPRQLPANYRIGLRLLLTDESK